MSTSTKQSKTVKNKVELLKQKREALNARIQKMESLEKNRERKRDTRRKILLGSYYLDKAIKESKMDDVKLIMDSYLKRDSDRELFWLEPHKE